MVALIVLSLNGSQGNHGLSRMPISVHIYLGVYYTCASPSKLIDIPVG